MAVCLGYSTAEAEVYFVRDDGSDACDGTRDEAGQSGACAFRTIERCLDAARCGDTCRVRAGEYFEDELTLPHACSPGAPLSVVGDGPGETRWYAGLRELTDCEREEDTERTWDCAAPEGSLLEPLEGAQCLLQKVIEPIPIADENGVSGDLADYVCATPWRDEDRDGDGKPELDDHPGTYVPRAEDPGGTGPGRYRLHGWNSKTPEQTRFFAPDDGSRSNSDDAIRITGSHVTIEGFTVLSGFYIGLRESGSHNTLENLDIYAGGLWIMGGSSHATVQDVTVRNNYRRPVDGSGTTGTAWDRNSQSLAVQGRHFTIRRSEFFGAREGCGFSSSAGPGDVDGLSCHWHHNHNLKLLDDAHGIRFTNCLSYNGQESLFIAGCVRDVTFRHCTLMTGNVAIHDDDGDGYAVASTCPDADHDGTGEHGPSNLDFYNNIMPAVIWHSVFGDPRGNPDHDFDFNVYLEDWPSFGSASYFQRDVARDVTHTSLAAWQQWEDDPCSGDCLRDPHSITSVTADEFVAFAHKDDSLPRPWDFDLRETARSVHQGSWSQVPASCRDLEGGVRTGPPDAGAYERQDASAVRCLPEGRRREARQTPDRSNRWRARAVRGR
jgi:hypothetical protein